MSEQITRTSSSVTATARPAAFVEPPQRFSVPLSATRRAARLARLLATEQLRSWELPLEPARLIVAELASNAATHARVPGRGFRLTLAVTSSTTLRIEVTDTRGDRLPVRAPVVGGGPAEGGYGLLLVEELADRWGVAEGPVPSKTVWAELDLVKRDSSLSVDLAADSASAETRL
ncbi:ATP-binding protein [Streptomyces sp. VNUA24]|uniref:ATP-binding protein n=1 Tax=Streptomyces sp. VNUA24 TaxID=3031131 RepID=UPI0023B7ECAC|nr:ATP-binding protein [Streptomyces sp. VNUA24]WEH16044.1 ATP-binding protein [Streptomyces sp. VNUA24]